MIRFTCPQCKAVHQAGDQSTGNVIACPTCGQRLRLPQPSPPAALPVTAALPVANPKAPDDIADEDEASLRAELPADYPAEAEKLGRPRFRVERETLPNNAFRPAFVAFACCIPAILCFPAGASPGSDLLRRFLGLVWIGGWAGFAAWWIAKQLRRKSVYAVVHTGGFVLYDGRGFSVWRWADVAKLNMQNIDQRSYVYFIQVDRLLTTWYRLRCHDGTEYRFWSTQGPRAAQFGLLVQNETYAQMLPAALARLQAGEPVDFGPFRMEPTGLSFRGHSLPWSQIGPMSFQQGKLLIDRLGANGGTAAALLEVVDNSHVFLSLVEQKLGRRIGE